MDVVTYQCPKWHSIWHFLIWLLLDITWSLRCTVREKETWNKNGFVESWAFFNWENKAQEVYLQAPHLLQCSRFMCNWLAAQASVLGLLCMKLNSIWRECTPTSGMMVLTDGQLSICIDFPEDLWVHYYYITGFCLSVLQMQVICGIKNFCMVTKTLIPMYSIWRYNK